jgi:hypothetical protein
VRRAPYNDSRARLLITRGSAPVRHAKHQILKRQWRVTTWTAPFLSLCCWVAVCFLPEPHKNPFLDLHNAITRRTPAEARHTTYSYVPRMSRHSFKILTLPKRRLKLRRAERRVLRPGPSNAVWCRQLRWCRVKTKSPAGSFVGEKSAPACSEATGCTSLRWRSVTRAPPTRRTQEILARNRSVNLLGFRDAVTVELWNSRNRVQIDRPGREVFCRGEREQADTSAPSSRLSRVIPF